MTEQLSGEVQRDRPRDERLLREDAVNLSHGSYIHRVQAVRHFVVAGELPLVDGELLLGDDVAEELLRRFLVRTD